MATARYSKEKRSTIGNIRGRSGTGATCSNTNRNRTSQKTVYTVLIGNSAAVNSKGNSETCPAIARDLNALKYRLSLRAMRLKGIMIRRTAFSWTCQPNRKEAYPQSVMAPTNTSQSPGLRHNLINGSYMSMSTSIGESCRVLKSRTSWNRKVSAKVCSLVTSGRTANEVSPTRPRVTLVRASSLIERPRRGATIRISYATRMLEALVRT